MPRFVNASRWNTSHLVAIYELVASRGEPLNNFEWVLVRDICFDSFVSVQAHPSDPFLTISFKNKLPEPDRGLTAIAKERAVADRVLGCLIHKLRYALFFKRDVVRKDSYHLPSWAEHLSLNYRDITPMPDAKRIYDATEDRETVRPELLTHEDMVALLELYEWSSARKFKRQVEDARRWRRAMFERRERDKDRLARLLTYAQTGAGELPSLDETEEEDDDDD